MSRATTDTPITITVAIVTQGSSAGSVSASSVTSSPVKVGTVTLTKTTATLALESAFQSSGITASAGSGNWTSLIEHLPKHVVVSDTSTATVTDDFVYAVIEGAVSNTQGNPVYSPSGTNGSANVAPNGSAITITNTYDASTSAAISGTKVFTHGTIEADQFSFTLSAENGTPMPTENTTVSAAAGTGAFTFGTITYPLRLFSGVTADANGVKTLTYEYTVTETLPVGAVNGIKDGILYDTTPKTITITVTYNTLTGVMSAAPNPATLSESFVNEQLGSLTVTKEILRNGTLDTNAAGGPFWYAVYDAPYDASASPAMTPVATGAITVSTGGTASDTVSNLTYGTYYVYELDAENGTPIVSGTNGTSETVAGVLYLVKGSGGTAEVGGTAGTATLQNDVRTMQITVTKQWFYDNAQVASYSGVSSISFNLYKDAETTAYTGSPYQITAADGWTWTSGDLPEGTYTVKEVTSSGTEITAGV